MMVNKAIVVRGRLLIKARRAVTMYRVKGDRIQTAQVTPGSAAQAKGGWSTTKPKPAGAKKKKRTRRKRAPRVEPPDRRERSAKPPTPDAPQDLAEVYAPPNWVGRVDDLGKLTLGGAREDGSRLSSDLAQTVIREALESAGVRFPNYGVSYSDPKFKSTRDVVTDGVTFRAVAESLVSALEQWRQVRQPGRGSETTKALRRQLRNAVGRKGHDRLRQAADVHTSVVNELTTALTRLGVSHTIGRMAEFDPALHSSAVRGVKNGDKVAVLSWGYRFGDPGYRSGFEVITKATVVPWEDAHELSYGDGRQEMVRTLHRAAHFAVHQDVDPSNGRSIYTVTHLPSGMRVASVEGKKHLAGLERFVDHVGQHAPEPLDWSGSRRGRHYNESAGIAAAMTSYPGWEAFTTRPHEVLSGAKRWDPALHEQEVSRR